MQFPQSRSTFLMMGLLSAVLGLSACEKQSEPDPTLHASISEEQDITMSAEPADVETLTVEATEAEVTEDTVSSVQTKVSQVAYVCTPVLKFDAIYNADAGNVTIKSDQGEVTLEKAGEGAFDAMHSLDGGAGLTQWRIADAKDDSGVLRVSTGEEDTVTTYNCSVASGDPSEANSEL